MKSTTQRPAFTCATAVSAVLRLQTITLGLSLAVSMAGCGAGKSAGTTISGNTTVTLFTTGTANDQLTAFGAQVTSLSLTNQKGETVSLLTSPILPDFIHENGTIEPFVNVSVPQGVYTSATATSNGGGFICETLDEPWISDSVYSYSAPVPDVAVTLPAPITVTGSGMGLLLDSMVSQSASFPNGCMAGGNDSYTFTPEFVLTPMTLAAEPTNSANGKAFELQGTIAAIDAETFSVTGIYYDGNTWRVTPATSVSYQGVTGFPQLAVGMPVDMDVTTQLDGSLTATRIAVYDTNPTNLSAKIATLLNSNEPNPESGTYEGQSLLFASYSRSWEAAAPGIGNDPVWEYSNATFQVSGQLVNVADLPFLASFTAADMVAGQRLMLTTHETLHDTASGYNLTSTITLIPQTINGTVSEIGNEGGFTTYTAMLAPYDAFPQFAAQPNQVSVLTDPNMVVVYADSNAQMLNADPIAVGSAVRFYGLVFNDNGTLRMDCAQINDGVAE